MQQLLDKVQNHTSTPTGATISGSTRRSGNPGLAPSEMQERGHQPSDPGPLTPPAAPRPFVREAMSSPISPMLKLVEGGADGNCPAPSRDILPPRQPALRSRQPTDTRPSGNADNLPGTRKLRVSSLLMEADHLLGEEKPSFAKASQAPFMPGGGHRVGWTEDHRGTPHEFPCLGHDTPGYHPRFFVGLCRTLNSSLSMHVRSACHPRHLPCDCRSNIYTAAAPGGPTTSVCHRGPGAVRPARTTQNCSAITATAKLMGSSTNACRKGPAPLVPCFRRDTSGVKSSDGIRCQQRRTAALPVPETWE